MVFKEGKKSPVGQKKIFSYTGGGRKKESSCICARKRGGKKERAGLKEDRFPKKKVYLPFSGKKELPVSGRKNHPLRRDNKDSPGKKPCPLSSGGRAKVFHARKKGISRQLREKTHPPWSPPGPKKRVQAKAIA